MNVRWFPEWHPDAEKAACEASIFMSYEDQQMTAHELCCITLATILIELQNKWYSHRAFIAVKKPAAI